MWWTSDYTDFIKYPFTEKADANEMADYLQAQGHDVEVWEWNPLAEDKDED